MTILIAFRILLSLPDVAGQATGTVIAKTIGPQATIAIVGATVGAAAAAVAIDEGGAHITDKKVGR